MPSEASAVGALVLPVPAAVAGSQFTDPVLETLLDFAAFYIRDALNVRLATIAPVGHTSIADAVPVANRFEFDPLEPRGHVVKLTVPALYLYWLGDSKVKEWTTIHTYRVRELHMLYVFPELPGIDQMVERYGLMNAVDSAMHKMTKRQMHDSYTPPGSAAGMNVSQALAARGVVDWKYLGGRKGRFGIDEGPLAERRAAKKSGRDFPALKGSFEVWERVLGMDLVDPTDVTPDIAVSVSGGEGADVVELFDSVLSAPDGSGEL